MSKNKQKLIVLGWDAAEWKVINPLMEQGKMPNLERFLKKGVYGKIQTMDPPLSPMLWTSIATGMRADKHGIIGFIEPTPDGESLRPVTSTSRKVKAIWNILNQKSYKSNVVGWWPSNPVEPINGVMVSNLFQTASKPLEEVWEIGPESVHPKSLEATLAALRVHPHEITLSMALPFLPNLGQDKTLRKDKRTLSVLKTIANAATVHACSTYLMQETEWDFMAIYHDAIDHFSHIGMRYHPPKRPEIDQKDYDDFNLVVEGAYRFHDLMLGRILDIIEEDTTLLIVSDHGFHTDHQRPLYIPSEPAGPAVEHSPYGIFAMAGPGIKKGGQEISGASVLDVTPTLLHYLGLAVGEDMDGKVLHACFENAKPVEFIPSWEGIAGDTGMHDKNRREDPWEALDALQQLVDLGYIDAPDDDKLKEVEKSKRENQYYLARNMLNGGNYTEALIILEEIFKASRIIRYGNRLAFTYLALKQYQQAKDILLQLIELNKEKQELRKKTEDPFGNAELEEPMYLQYIEGLLYLAINRPRIALPILEEVQRKNPNNFQVAMNIAQIHNQRKNFSAAEKQFIRALAIDDRSAKAHHGLALSLLRRDDYENAIDELLLAIEQDFYMPLAHYHLGECLFKTGQYREASQAFEVAIRLAPGLTKAHQWLQVIYRDHIVNPTRVEDINNFLAKNIVSSISICTSVDGIETASLFEKLAENGIKINNSQAIKDQISTLPQSNAFLSELKNEMIFIPCHLLSFLPANHSYRLLLLNDAQDQVLNNLKLKHKSQFSEGVVPTDLIVKTQKDQEKINIWMTSQAGLPCHYLDIETFVKEGEDSIFLLKNFFYTD